MVSAIPEGTRTVTPHLVIKGASKAIDFYTRAFGAREHYRMPGPDGLIGHAELQIGDAPKKARARKARAKASKRRR